MRGGGGGVEEEEEQEKRNSPAQKNWEGVLVNISSICGFDTVFVFRKINVTGVQGPLCFFLAFLFEL